MNVSQLRTRLLLTEKSPFFSSLALELELKENKDIDTYRTDGQYLEYNQDFVDSQTEDENLFCIAHEAMHCGLRHMYRIEGRDLEEFNAACDYAINLLLVNAGFTPPKDVLLDQSFKDMSAEQIYSIMQKRKRENPPQPSKPEDGSGKKSKSTGDFVPAPGDGKPEIQWILAADKANALCKKRGVMPGDVEGALDAARKPKIDVLDAIRRFVERTIASYTTWAKPNRRYLGEDLYLPGEVKENMPPIVFAIDTSGSIWADPKLRDFFCDVAREVLDIYKPETLHVVYCDAKVKRVESFSPDEDVIMLPLGGGGTRFKPVFDWVAENEITPCCLIYMTDLEGDNPEEPNYPVLWTTTEATKLEGPFGDTIRLPF